MRKGLKIAGGIILALLVIILIGGLLGPKSFKTERSIVIHAPRHAIFTHLSDYHYWPEWSPWYELDTSCQYEYFGTQGEADAGYRWQGNDKAGQGEMLTIEIAQDMRLVCRIHFIKPFESLAHATFTLDSAAGGDTKVTWAFANDIPFLMRPVMAFMNMEKMIGSDFEKGLAKLKKVCEATPATSYEISEVELPAATYIAYRTQTSTDSVGALFPRWMPRVYEYVKAHKLEMAGAPAGLYYTWDPEHKKTDMAIAIPVKKADKAGGDYKVLTVPASKAVKLNYYGDYGQMVGAHTQIGQYIEAHKLKQQPPVIEAYVTDPGTEKDPAKVLTEIYYPIQ